MDCIIVTVTDMNRRFLYDLELPVGITIDKLKDDMVEALNGYNPELFLRTMSTQLYSNKLGRNLTSCETLESAGICNGEYITIVEV